METTDNNNLKTLEQISVDGIIEILSKQANQEEAAKAVYQLQCKEIEQRVEAFRKLYSESGQKQLQDAMDKRLTDALCKIDDLERELATLKGDTGR